jgi:hypothetical protein
MSAIIDKLKEAEALVLAALDREFGDPPSPRYEALYECKVAIWKAMDKAALAEQDLDEVLGKAKGK